MDGKHQGRRHRPRIELIDLPDEPTGPGTTVSGPERDGGRAKRRLRGRRVRFIGAAVAAVVALVVAQQLLPGTPTTSNANRPVQAPTTPRPHEAARHNARPDPSINASIRATTEDGSEARSLRATAGDCRLAGLREEYPAARAVATNIRSALADRIDPKGKHLQSGTGQVNCIWPGGTDRREVQLILTWTSGAYRGLIFVNVANFDDPTMTGCGTGWSCTRASARHLHAKTARIIRDTGDRGFGVVVERTDRQYVSIEAGAASTDNNAIDPTRSLSRFPFAARKLLTVAVDPRVRYG